MSERPSFNPVRAGFYLLGVIVALFVIVVLIIIGTCAYNSLMAGAFRCESADRLENLMLELLTITIAFTAGFRSQPKE